MAFKRQFCVFATKSLTWDNVYILNGLELVGLVCTTSTWFCFNNSIKCFPILLFAGAVVTEIKK